MLISRLSLSTSVDFASEAQRNELNCRLLLDWRLAATSFVNKSDFASLLHCSTSPILLPSTFVLTKVDFFVSRGEIGGRQSKMSIALWSPDGRVVGGQVGGILSAAGPVQALNAQSRAMLMAKLNRSGITSGFPGALGTPLLNGTGPTQHKQAV
ncbi:hypothetical protein L2E82_25565 [Cichorium intybus]|uniref:Uncharacterized protein n=1 Tax=Cichorium intybus TaxID=13427 RepID=A0ACB9E3U2_CICIN|nr:hypothetical protein L2E82_25565 [Cichorium intybus]